MEGAAAVAELGTTIASTAAAPAVEVATAAVNPAVTAAAEAVSAVTQTTVEPLAGAASEVTSEGTSIATQAMTPIEAVATEAVPQAAANALETPSAMAQAEAVDNPPAETLGQGVTVAEAVPETTRANEALGQTGESTSTQTPAETATPTEASNPEAHQAVLERTQEPSLGSSLPITSESELEQRVAGAREQEAAEWANTQFAQGMPEDIVNNEDFKDITNEVTAEANTNVSKYPDQDSIIKESLKRFRLKIAGKKEEEDEDIRKLTPEQQADLAAREIAELKKQVETLTNQIKELNKMIKELAENQLELIEDAEKKESLLRMLVKLTLIVGASTLTGAKDSGALNVTAK
jgi:hypothetical protein